MNGEQNDFHEAINTGDVEEVERCIQAGVNPSAYDNYAIQMASSNGHLSVVNRLLLDPRVDPNSV